MNIHLRSVLGRGGEDVAVFLVQWEHVGPPGVRIDACYVLIRLRSFIMRSSSITVPRGLRAINKRLHVS